VPALQRIPRGCQYLVRDLLLHQLMHRRWMRRGFQVLAKAFLRLSIDDPGLRAKLSPDYEIGCKRILITNGWYRALNKPNVSVETSPIREVGEHAVITADGVEHPVDTIVLATGFHATDPPIAHRLHGRDGRSLAQTWGNSPRAYRGVTTANFPNLFRIGSIGTGTGHISHILQIESGVRYAVEALRTMNTHALASVEITAPAQDQYARRVHDKFRDTVWVTGGCNSWYLDKSGEPSVNWPSTARRYRNWTHRFDVENYHVAPAAAAQTRKARAATAAIAGPTGPATR
jgi:cation diffusion facilitator CzcD-associated flavoprotein CzcO